MKRSMTVCLSLLLLFGLASCAGPEGENTSAPPAETSTPPVVESTPLPEEKPTQQDLFNAVQREDLLAVVLYSPTEEELQAVSDTTHLTLLDDSDGQYYDEVLVVPRYGDCAVSVDYIQWDEEGADYTVTGNFGSAKGGEKDSAVGGVFIRSMLPEGFPSLMVTVSRTADGKTQSGSYLLGYDGRGGSSVNIWAEQ